MKDKFTLAVIQEQSVADKNQALANSIAQIKEAAKQGAELVLLQELHCGYYFCQTEDPKLFDLAEPIPGPSSKKLCDLAKSLDIVIVASLFEKRAPGLYHNTAVVIEKDGKIAGKYRKMHIPDDPGYGEKFYFTPGDLGFQPIQTSIAKLGVLICWDQWFPEAARLMALAGAEILLYPTAIGWEPEDNEAEKTRQLEAWLTIQRSHAIANGIPVAVCNRVGHEPSPQNNEDSQGIDFWGSSFVLGPQGEILKQASNQNPEILITEINKQQSETVRRIWPFLRDRRIDDYTGLTKRYLDEQ